MRWLFLYLELYLIKNKSCRRFENNKDKVPHVHRQLLNQHVPTKMAVFT